METTQQPQTYMACPNCKGTEFKRTSVEKRIAIVLIEKNLSETKEPYYADDWQSDVDLDELEVSYECSGCQRVYKEGGPNGDIEQLIELAQAREIDSTSHNSQLENRTSENRRTLLEQDLS